MKYFEPPFLVIFYLKMITLDDIFFFWIIFTFLYKEIYFVLKSRVKSKNEGISFSFFVLFTPLRKYWWKLVFLARLDSNSCLHKSNINIVIHGLETDISSINSRRWSSQWKSGTIRIFNTSYEHFLYNIFITFFLPCIT